MVGLKISMKKTKVMFDSLGRDQQLTTGSKVLEMVRECIYLGRVVAAEPDHKGEITRRIRMG